MKHLLLILLVLPFFADAQYNRRGSYVGQEYDSATNTYWYVRKDFPPTMATKQYFYGVRGMQSFIIFPDTLRLWNYRGKNHGTIDTLVWINQGVLRQSPADQLDVSKLGGTWPASRISGTITASAYSGTLPYTQVGTGRAKTYPTRTFGTAFTPSITRDVFVKYTCSITATMSLTSGQSGIIYLESSTNGTTWVEEDRMVNSNSGALTIGLNLVQSQTGALSAVIPAGTQVRVRSTGTATNVLVSAVETVL